MVCLFTYLRQIAICLLYTSLVLHGASGLSEEDVVECVQRGMCKVNFATELRVAYTDAEKQLLKENPETFDPKKLGIAAMKAVKMCIRDRPENLWFC